MDQRKVSIRFLGVGVLLLVALLLGVAAAGCGGTSTTTTASSGGSASEAPTSVAAGTAPPTTASGLQIPTTLHSTATTANSSPAGVNAGELTYGANTLEYAHPVTDAQAQKLLDYLASTFSWDKTSKTGMALGIAMTGNVYDLAMVITNGKEMDPTVLASAKTLAQEVSKKIFGGAEVDVYLTDSTWNTLAVVQP